MLWGGHSGGLEVRKRASGALALHGRFPYGKRTVMSDGGRNGRPRKEIIAPRAFGFRVDNPNEDIRFLLGHNYDKPLASRAAGTLDIRDGDEALTFDATITDEMQGASYVQDFLRGLASGLILGLSPGFRIPPPRTVPNAETVEEEDPAEGRALIRTVHQALLYEVSAVTSPQYEEAQIEARSWDIGQIDQSDPSLARALNRWRL